MVRKVAKARKMVRRKRGRPKRLELERIEDMVEMA